MRLAHISDLHFGHHDPVVSAALAADLRRQAPDLVVASGDFTQIGSNTEFAQARAFLDELGTPVFAVPGNHDLGRNPVRRFLDPYGLYRRFISPEIEPFMEIGNVALAGLNTTRRMMADRDWSNGSINAHQLEMLAKTFERAAPGAIRVVVAHHPLMQPAAATAAPTRSVRRAELALQSFAALGVRLVLSGHFHLSFVRRYEAHAIAEGVPRGPREAATAPILVAQASSAISTRLRGEPNAYNLIVIEGRHITLSVRAWDGSGWHARETASATA